MAWGDDAHFDKLQFKIQTLNELLSPKITLSTAPNSLIHSWCKDPLNCEEIKDNYGFIIARIRHKIPDYPRNRNMNMWPARYNATNNFLNQSQVWDKLGHATCECDTSGR